MTHRLVHKISCLARSQTSGETLLLVLFGMARLLWIGRVPTIPARLYLDKVGCVEGINRLVLPLGLAVSLHCRKWQKQQLKMMGKERRRTPNVVA